MQDPPPLQGGLLLCRFPNHEPRGRGSPSKHLLFSQQSISFLTICFTDFFFCQFITKCHSHPIGCQFCYPIRTKSGRCRSRACTCSGSLVLDQPKLSRLNPKRIGKKWGSPRVTVRMGSGRLRVARGGCGAKDPPLAARP